MTIKNNRESIVKHFVSGPNRSRFTTAGFIVALLIAGRGYAQFEGIVETKNITTDEMGKVQEFVMTMWIKRDMVRIETKGGTLPGSTMIYRTDQKKIYMVNDEDKTFFEISQDEKAQEIFGVGGTSEKYSVKKTGKKKAIAGYSCDQFIIKRNNEVTELWGTKKLGQLVRAISKAMGQEHTNVAEGATNEVMKMGIYPMLSATKLDDNLIESQEVTRVETKSLDVALFNLPPGYKKQKSVEMMDDLQGK